MLFHSSDLKEFGNTAISSKLIEECNYLERNGINIQIGHKNYKIYICLGLLLGDNLEQNTMLGFMQFFRANCYCRFCKCSRIKMENHTTQNCDKLRNEENCAIDIDRNDVSESGIKENSVWNPITSFQVTKNFSVDIVIDQLKKN